MGLGSWAGRLRLLMSGDGFGGTGSGSADASDVSASLPFGSFVLRNSSGLKIGAFGFVELEEADGPFDAVLTPLLRRLELSVFKVFDGVESSLDELLSVPD